MVEEVLPRTSQLSEPAVANVDHVLLVFSAALPAFQPSPATRYLLSAEAAWLPVTVAVNKADLLPAEEVQAVVDQVCVGSAWVIVVRETGRWVGRPGVEGAPCKACSQCLSNTPAVDSRLGASCRRLNLSSPTLPAPQVASWGYRGVAVSVVSGQGLQELMQVLRGRVTVVAGPSGAGKSSIINALRLRSAGLDSSLDAMAAEPSGAAAGSGGEEEEEEEEEEGEQEGEDSGEEEQRQQGSQAAPGASGQAEPGRRQDVAQPPVGSTEQPQPQRQPQQQRRRHVGVSSVAQPPAGVELQAVGQVSQRIGRGKHTTRNVTLLELEGGGGVDGMNGGSSSSSTGSSGGSGSGGSGVSGGGGLVVDTPGFNQPDLADMPATDLWQHFPEIRRLLEEDRWVGGRRILSRAWNVPA